MTLFKSCKFLSCTKTSFLVVDDKSETKLRSIALPTLLTLPCKSRCSVVNLCNFSFDLVKTSRNTHICSSFKVTSCGSEIIIILYYHFFFLLIFVLATKLMTKTQLFIVIFIKKMFSAHESIISKKKLMYTVDT